MKYRALILIFAINILFVTFGFSQQPDRYNNIQVVQQFNSWLALTGINKLLIAIDYNIKPTGYPTSGIAHANGIGYLTLKPTETYSDPEKFGRAWSNLLDKFAKQGIDINMTFYNKLHEDIFFDHRDIAVVILANSAAGQTAANTDFSTNRNLFYFEITARAEADGFQEVTAAGNMIIERGSSDVEVVDADMSVLKDVCIDTSKPVSIQLALNTLNALFKTYPAGSGGNIKIDSLISAHKTNIIYSVSNIDGVVTRSHLHELIYINIVLDPKGICYNIDVRYAGGNKAPDAAYAGEYYHEAAIKYRKEFDGYRDNLERTLRKAFHATN